MLLDVHVDGVLDSTSGGGGTAAVTTEQPSASAVSMLLLRDASLPQGSKPVQQFIHSSLRPVFSGPDARLAAGELYHHSAAVTSGQWWPAGQPMCICLWPHDGDSAFAGCRLRLGICRLQRTPKLSGRPPRLLPTAETVVVFDDLAVAPQQLQTQLFHLSAVRAQHINGHPGML